MAYEISNEYWYLRLADDRPMVEYLAYDATGRSSWCANLLKIRSPRGSVGLAAGCGGQTGYFDRDKRMIVSSSGGMAAVQKVGTQELIIVNAVYGDVRENWRIRLDGSRLIWTVDQVWGADLELLDAFVPGLFIAARKEFGEATMFQLWDLDMEQDDFYGHEAIVGGASPISRRTRREEGGSGLAKILSHARPDGDLLVRVTKHLKKGEILNKMSFLAQALWCEPASTFQVRKDQNVLSEFVLEPVRQESGLALDICAGGKLQEDILVNRRFYDSHVNCAILADTVNWRFGNEPSGYVALFCQYMYSEMVRYGVSKAGLGIRTNDPFQVLLGEVQDMANNLLETGSIGGGYQSDTSLDLIPSFLLTMRNQLVINGQKELGEKLFPAAWSAVRQILHKLEKGEGMIVSERKLGNDYWDWLMRDGRLTSVNVITYSGLAAFCEIARWLGHAEEYSCADAAAQRLKHLFNTEFWNDDLGYYTDWIGLDGRKMNFFYTGPQLQAIVSGMVPADRAKRIVESIEEHRRELGDEWADCFSIQTNFYDAQIHTTPYMDGFGEVTTFGQTMNGGCLLSWNYYWIGALVKCGKADQALRVWRGIVGRFAETSLLEGSNFWDFAGRPSRTTPAAYEVEAFEPFLSDQGLVSVALPRWLFGIDAGLDKLEVVPVLPPSAYPAKARFVYLGQEIVVEIDHRGSRITKT